MSLRELVEAGFVFVTDHKRAKKCIITALQENEKRGLGKVESINNRAQTGPLVQGPTETYL